MPADLPVIAFATPEMFRQWLAKNSAEAPGLWMKIAKKASGVPSLSYTEAVVEAICYGWIDGQRNALDETYFLQKFTPRGKRSVWSKVNVAHVERLEKEGRMQPAGIATVEAAKADGRWDAAYSGAGSAELPPEFLAALEKEPEAKAFFETLNKTQRYPYFFRLVTAKKPETKAKRIVDFVEKLKRGEKLN